MELAQKALALRRGEDLALAAQGVQPILSMNEEMFSVLPVAKGIAPALAGALDRA